MDAWACDRCMHFENIPAEGASEPRIAQSQRPALGLGRSHWLLPGWPLFLSLASFGGETWFGDSFLFKLWPTGPASGMSWLPPVPSLCSLPPGWEIPPPSVPYPTPRDWSCLQTLEAGARPCPALCTLLLPSLFCLLLHFCPGLLGPKINYN